MASAVFVAAQQDLAHAQEAQKQQQKALVTFQAACIAGDWAAADKARIEACGHLEAYLDHLMAAHRRTKEG